MRSLVLLALLLPVASVSAQECWDSQNRQVPCPDDSGLQRQPEEQVREVEAPPPAPFTLTAALGAQASLSSEASAAEPLLELAAAFNAREDAAGPQIAALLRLGALPGEAVSLSDPSSFRSLSTELTLSYKIGSQLRLAPAVQVGAEFRFAGDSLPLHRAARYGYFGTRVDGSEGYLFLGVGGDERLSTSSRETPAYLPAAAMAWRVRLGDLTGAIDAYLTGRILLFLRLGYGAASAGSDVAQVGVMVGFGAKK